jgi:hypothetical protein
MHEVDMRSSSEFSVFRWQLKGSADPRSRIAVVLIQLGSSVARARPREIANQPEVFGVGYVSIDLAREGPASHGCSTQAPVRRFPAIK